MRGSGPDIVRDELAIPNRDGLQMGEDLPTLAEQPAEQRWPARPPQKTPDRLLARHEVDLLPPIEQKFAIRGAGLPVASACGADGICGRCAVEVTRGSGSLAPETVSEQQVKARNRIDPRLRLACRVSLRSDIAVSTPYW